MFTSMLAFTVSPFDLIEHAVSQSVTSVTSLLFSIVTTAVAAVLVAWGVGRLWNRKWNPMGSFLSMVVSAACLVLLFASCLVLDGLSCGKFGSVGDYPTVRTVKLKWIDASSDAKSDVQRFCEEVFKANSTSRTRHVPEQNPEDAKKKERDAKEAALCQIVEEFRTAHQGAMYLFWSALGLLLVVTSVLAVRNIKMVPLAVSK